MSRPTYTAIYMLAIIGSFFVLSLIYQSCGKKEVATPTQEELEEKLIDAADTYSDEDEFFEDDVAQEEGEEIDYSSSEDSYTSSTSESSNTSSSSTPSYSSSSSRGDYVVIAGNYLVEGNASEMVRKLRSSGYNDAEKVVFDLSRYYTVIAGSYDSRSLANSISSELEGKGIDNYVLRRRR